MSQTWTKTPARPNTWELDEGNGHRWVIRPSTTSGDKQAVALFRLAPGQKMPTRASIRRQNTR